MHTNEESITITTGRALSWSYFGSFVRLVLRFGVNILLTRLLGPKPFGELAVAMLLFGFGNLLASVGITAALIQKEDLTTEDVRFCHTSQVLMGVFISSLVAITAPLWAQFFRQPELTHLLRVFAPLFLFQSLGTTATALLNRQQNTRAIQIASVISYVVAFLCIAAPMALLGYGVWSLVAAYLAQALVNSVGVYLQMKHSLRPLLHRDGIVLFRFGASVLGANLCSWGISNLDNTVVGRVLGSVALGLYSRAFSLASMPAESIISNLLQILLPSFSRVQGDTRRLARAYMTSIGLLALVLLPPFSAMAAIPGVVVLGLYGSKWVGAVRLFQPLALAIPVNAIMALSGPILASRGKPHLEMRLQFWVLLAAIVTFWLSVQQSLLCLSWTVLAVYLLRFAILTQSALREVNARWVDIFQTIWPGFVLAGIATGSALLLNAALPLWSSWLHLIVVATGTAFVVILCVALGNNIFLRPVLQNAPQMQDLVYRKLARVHL